MTCQWLRRMSRNESQPCALPNMLGRLREYAPPFSLDKYTFQPLPT